MKLLDKNVTDFSIGTLTIALAIRWVVHGISAEDFFAFFFLLLLFVVKLMEEDIL